MWRNILSDERGQGDPEHLGTLIIVLIILIPILCWKRDSITPLLNKLIEQDQQPQPHFTYIFIFLAIGFIALVCAFFWQRKKNTTEWRKNGGEEFRDIETDMDK